MKSLKLIVPVMIFFMVISSCEMENNAVEILSFESSDSFGLAGDTIMLYCVAEDGDGDKLGYSWETSSGVFSTKSDSTEWIPPFIEGTFLVTCKVSDGVGSSDARTIPIRVEVPTPVPVNGLSWTLTDSGLLGGPNSSNDNNTGVTGYWDGTVEGANYGWNVTEQETPNRQISQSLQFKVENSANCVNSGGNPNTQEGRATADIEITGSDPVTLDIDFSGVGEAEIALKNSEERYRGLFYNLTDAIILVNENNDILDMNPASFRLLGLNKNNNQDINLYDFISKEDVSIAKIKSKELRKKGEIKDFEVNIIDAKGKHKIVELSSNAVYVDGKFKGSRDILRDVTEKKKTNNELVQSLKEKEVLLKEVHHRVKNNLQVISSILNLQSTYVEDEKTLSILRESQNRVKSMSFIHESLYRTKDFNSIDFSEYIERLANNMVYSYQYSKNRIALKLEIEEVFLSLDISIPCGLIINELLSNALKYAFLENQKGEIYISVKELNDSKIQIKVEDNGVGFPEDLDINKVESLGMLLVNTLVEQIDGDIEIRSKEGTKYLITFDR